MKTQKYLIVFRFVLLVSTCCYARPQQTNKPGSDTIAPERLRSPIQYILEKANEHSAAATMLSFTLVSNVKKGCPISRDMPAFLIDHMEEKDWISFCNMYDRAVTSFDVTFRYVVGFSIIFGYIMMTIVLNSFVVVSQVKKMNFGESPFGARKCLVYSWFFVRSFIVYRRCGWHQSMIFARMHLGKMNR